MLAIIIALLKHEKYEVQAAIFLLKGSFSSYCVDNAYNISYDFPKSYFHQISVHHLLSPHQ